MFTLKIENSNGEIFEITHNTGDYIVDSITGLAYPQIGVNAAESGGDGAIYGSSKAQMRNLVIYVLPRGRVEENRQRLYRMFHPKEPCTVYFKNANRDVKIKAYVEVLEGSYFDQPEKIQISLLCPQPFFESADAIYAEISYVLKLFEFPFAISTPVEFSAVSENSQAQIENTGDISCGVKITMIFSGAVTDVTLYCVNLGTFCKVEYSFQSGDEAEISTLPGDIFAILKRGSDEINLIPYVSENSDFFRIPPGVSSFTVTLGTGNAESVETGIECVPLYGGV